MSCPNCESPFHGLPCPRGVAPAASGPCPRRRAGLQALDNDTAIYEWQHDGDTLRVVMPRRKYDEMGKPTWIDVTIAARLPS